MPQQPDMEKFAYRPVIWTRDQMAATIKGRWITGGDRQWYATGLTRSLETVCPGDLFIATTDNGRRAVQTRLKDLCGRGAVAAIVDVDIADAPDGAQVFRVQDAMEALRELSATARARTRAMVIGVTGTVGKTSTKDALARVLSYQGPTVANFHTMNDSAAVCETLASIPPLCRFAVVETSMLGPGSVGRKARFLQPDVAVITSIGTAHLAYHRSEQSIAQSKAEIYDHLARNGVAILPYDSPYREYLIDRVESGGKAAKIIGFGEGPGADFRLAELRFESGGTAVRAICLGREVRYFVPMPGKHHAMNSLAVLAAVSAAGGDVEIAADKYAHVRPSFRRGEHFRVSYKGGAVDIYDDSWNANPESMQSALDVLGILPATGRRIAFLGDMLELGDQGSDFHIQLLAELPPHVELVCTVGKEIEAAAAHLPSHLRGPHCADSKAMARIAREIVEPDDVVLVKGSNGMQMWRIVEALVGGVPRQAVRSGGPDR